MLERISRGEVAGFTSSAVLSNAAHRVMTMEAAASHGWPMTGIAYRLARHPTELRSLSQFRKVVDEVPNFGVQVLSVALSHVLSAAALSQQYGLLSGDALVAAVMQAGGLTQLASSDSDFDRVPWMTRFAAA